MSKHRSKKTVSLILGSGGARGLTHIGAIRELEKQGFEIKAVVGCSMGALIGGFYCAGHLDTYADWVSELNRWDVMRFLDVTLKSSSGMMKGDMVIATLKDLVGDQKIQELPVPFTAVATDLKRKTEVWLNEGDLYAAIRASISVPGIFTPKVINGRTLVDGGLLNPLPAAPTNFYDTDLTIAVNLMGRDVAEPWGDVDDHQEKTSIEEYHEKIEGFIDNMKELLGADSKDKDSDQDMSVTDVLLGMFDTMQTAIARYRLAAYPPDILIDIPSNICDTHEFHKARPLIEAGHYWTRQALDQHHDLVEGIQRK